MTVIKAIDTTIETALLKNMSDKETYTQYINYVDFKRLLPYTSTVLGSYSKYFELYPEHTCVNWGEFYTQFTQNWHSSDLEQQDIDYYRDYVFPAIENCDGMDINKCMTGLIQKRYVDDINISVQNGLDVSKLREIIDTYETKIGVNTEIDKEARTALSIDYSVLDKSVGIPWFMPSLQRSLMSLTMGQFVVVSADFGSGKSAFVISQLVHTLKWLHKTKSKQPVLYLNSEGTAADVFTRFFSCLYKDKINGGFEEVLERIDEVLGKYKEAYDAQQVIVFQLSDVPTLAMVKAKIHKYKPCLVIIDICDRLAPEGDVQALKTLYDDCRVLSGAYCPIIGTSQSGDTSYFDEKEKKNKNQKWLGGSKTYGSRTGKPGAADTIITIGKEDEDSMLRYINIAKKKRGEAVKITCELQPQYSYFNELTY